MSSDAIYGFSARSGGFKTPSGADERKCHCPEIWLLLKIVWLFVKKQKKNHCYEFTASDANKSKVLVGYCRLHVTQFMSKLNESQLQRNS